MGDASDRPVTSSIHAAYLLAAMRDWRHIDIMRRAIWCILRPTLPSGLRHLAYYFAECKHFIDEEKAIAYFRATPIVSRLPYHCYMPITARLRHNYQQERQKGIAQYRAGACPTIHHHHSPPPIRHTFRARFTYHSLSLYVIYCRK